MSQNHLVVDHLQKLSVMYQIKGDSWRASACSKAAEGVETFNEVITPKNVTSIPGVGKGLGETILEYLAEGTSTKYTKLTKDVDPQCLTMTVVKSVGPKTAWKFYQDGIKNFDELVTAWEKGKLDPRFDEPMRQAIARKNARLNHYAAKKLGNALLDVMQSQPGVIRASLAGSVRRQKETSGDLDILVSAKAGDASRLIAKFASLGKVINQGPKKASIWFTLGDHTIQADLLVIPDSSFGAALQYFTGPKEHNISIRRMAQKIGYKVNENGIFDADGKKLGGKNEEDIYSVLGIEMLPPEERQ